MRWHAVGHVVRMGGLLGFERVVLGVAAVRLDARVLVLIWGEGSGSCWSCVRAVEEVE
jgi:hypothetical protein